MQGSLMTDHELIRRYLLGKASPDEQVSLESRYLSDTETFEELTTIENDLIDSYARGRLTSADKQLFERKYLATVKGRARVDFARALLEVSAHEPAFDLQRQPSLWQRSEDLFRPQKAFRWGIVAACAIVLVVAIASFRHAQAPEQAKSDPVPSQKIEQTDHSGETTSKDLRNEEVAQEQTPQIAEFVLRLEPGGSRSFGSGYSRTTFAPSSVGILILQLTIENDQYRSYIAQIESVDGKELRRTGNLKSRLLSGKHVVDVRVPHALVPAGDYIVELKGTGDGGQEESVESYGFRIAYRKPLAK